MDRLTVLCFAGTYGLALATELARFAARLREGVRRYITVGLMALGWLVHTAYLANLAIQKQAVPVTTAFESLLALSWVLAGIGLYLTGRAGGRRPTVAGPLVLALGLAALTVAGLWASRAQSDWVGSTEPRWLPFWGTIHALFLMLGAVFTCLAFVFGLLYLAQSWRLKRKRMSGPGRRIALPSLEQSERWNRAAITLAFPLLTAGMLIGVALIIATARLGGTSLTWTDPKVLSTGALWLVFAALLHARYRPEWRGRRVMILTVVAFLFLAFAMVGVGLILPTNHQGLPAWERSGSDPNPSQNTVGRTP